MKRIIYLFIITTIITIVCLTCSKKKTEIMNDTLIREAIKQELTLHTKATLIDLYKNFFQGRFGPGHMISDREAVTSYFYHELETATAFDSVLWQSVGYDENFYRINLSLVRDSIIDGQELITAFIESADAVESPSPELWIKEWDGIIKVIERMDIQLQNYEEEKVQLEELLNNGHAAFHHSDIYHEHYNPHYRIVSKEHFDKLREMLR